MDSSVSGKDEIWFLRVCHHVPHELYLFLLCCVASVRPAAEFRKQHRNDLDCWDKTEPRTVGIRRIETVMHVVNIRVTSLMKQQFVIHIFRQTEIPTLLDGGVTNTPSVKVPCPQKIACPYIFVCLSVGLLMFCQVFSVSCKIVRRWVTSYHRIMRNMIVRNI